MLTHGLEEGRGGTARQLGHMDERKGEREWRGRGDQPGREGEQHQPQQRHQLLERPLGEWTESFPLSPTPLLTKCH